MNISDVKAIARELMDHHGLGRWKLIIISSKSMAGYCQTARWSANPSMSWGTIALSSPYMDVFDEAEVRETVLHEIAHALNNPSNRPHGPEWRSIALRIGSTGKRCVDSSAPNVVSRYIGKCEQGHEYPRHKKTSSLTSNDHYCRPCRKKYGKTTDKREMITWFDTYTNEVLNSTKKAAPVVAPSRTRVSQKRSASSSKVSTPKSTSWKDRYDKGMSSFGDDW